MRLYDRRTIERNIKKGLITRKDYEKFLKALDDAKDKGTQGEEIVDDADDADDIDETEDEAETIAAEPPAGGSNSH